MSPARFSVRQHILVNLLFYVAMIAGIVMLGRVPVDFYPDISFNTAQITTEWAGASADEVERLVTTKIEDEIKSVPGIKEIRSRSGSDLSIIEVEWQETLTHDEYARDLAALRGALERVTDLPEDSKQPRLREMSVAEMYASMVVAVVDEGDVGELALREVARDLRDRLDDLPGIRRVQLRAVRDRELHVVVDRNALHAADLTLPEVATLIERNNRNIPAGSLQAGTTETTIRATGNLPGPTALAGMVVKKNPNGRHLRLRDVGRVEFGFDKQRMIGRYLGHPAALLNIAKESDADLIRVSDAIHRFVTTRQAYLPAGIKLVVTFDSSDYIVNRLGVLRNNLLVGIVVVIAILWLTLGFRNALLAVVALPFCYLTAIILFPLLGISVNSLSIVGMILVSGMLVDDAIIVLENIYRHIEAGQPVRDAVIHGADEVMWPVIASVATTVAAFAPLLLISGVSGEFMSILPKTVIICLTASLVECLFVLPAHYLTLGSGRHEVLATETPPRTSRGLSAWSRRIRAHVDAGLVRARDAYIVVLEGVLAHRLAWASLLVGIATLTAGVAVRLPVDLFANEYNSFFVSLYCPPTYSVQRTGQVMREIEALLGSFGPDELRDFSSYAGLTMNPDTIPILGPHLGVAYVTVANTRANREHPERILRKVRQRVHAWHAAHPDEATNVLVLPPRDGPPVGKPVAVQIRADDYGTAKRLAGEMKAFLSGLPGVYNIEDNLMAGARELGLRMNDTRASLHGLTFTDLALGLRAASDGLVASTFYPADSTEDLDIRVLYAPRYRRSARDLLDTEVRGADGVLVKLGSVAHLDFGRSYLSLGHYDTRRSVIVYADVVKNVTTSAAVNNVLRARFTDLGMRYPNVQILYGGEFQETQKAFSGAFRILPIALLMIYVILAAQFRSYSQPLLVMLAVPFGAMGVLLGLALFGYPISFSIMYVIIGLSGVVVNDSLILVDFANRSVRDGTPVYESVLAAGRTRFRPVMLTSVTTVGALLPTAFGLFGRSISFGPLAAAFACGLALATVFTLLFVPAAYYSATLRWRPTHSSQPATSTASGMSVATDP